MKQSCIKKLFEVIICTVCPFIIPIIMGLFYEKMDILYYWIIYIIFALLDTIGIILIHLKNIKLTDNSWENESTRNAYSNLYTVNEIKRDHLIKKSYNEHYTLPHDSIPYDVHEYIGDICKSFSNTIATISNIRKENISVSFIYRYIYQDSTIDDNEWRWVIGKETTLNTPIMEFVSNKETVFYQLINSKSTAIFCNDKKEFADKEQYYLSARDNRHNKIGSFFAAKIMFSNNARSFSEGIIMVSSYGKCFVEKNNTHSQEEFKKLIIDDIFPCYQRMIETELGVLYFRHNKNSQQASH